MRRPGSSSARRRRPSRRDSSGRARRWSSGWNPPRRASRPLEADRMPDENDMPLTEDERARAREGQALIAAAMADVRAPQSLREAIERERAGAAVPARVPFWRRHRVGFAAAGIAAAALAVV